MFVPADTFFQEFSYTHNAPGSSFVSVQDTVVATSDRRTIELRSFGQTIRQQIEDHLDFLDMIFLVTRKIFTLVVR